MATTFLDLVREVETYVYTLGVERDKVTSLTAPLDAASLTFPVADARQVDRGYIEIDNELLAVASTDSTANTVTLHPWGRGYHGTTAAAHAQGVRVTNNPRFSRWRIRSEINQVIDGLFPELFNVKSSEGITFNPVKVSYPLPADAESVINVRAKTIGPSGRWQPITRWQFDRLADTTDFPTGRSIDIFEQTSPGRTVKVLYRANFGDLVNDSDLLTTAGISEGWRDIIRFLTAARLIMALDSARLQTDSMEAMSRGALTQPMQASAVAKQLVAFAEDRVQSERASLRRLYPTTQVRTN